jgi:hypothetical protein
MLTGTPVPVVGLDIQSHLLEKELPPKDPKYVAPLVTPLIIPAVLAFSPAARY